MPRPRDQRLYFELQGKLTQQEVDYNNMHQHRASHSQRAAAAVSAAKYLTEK